MQNETIEIQLNDEQKHLFALFCSIHNQTMRGLVSSLLDAHACDAQKLSNALNHFAENSDLHHAADLIIREMALDCIRSDSEKFRKKH